VSLVVTDPPYVDNVHYSELADFFRAWLRGIGPYRGYPKLATTRRREVQNTRADDIRATVAGVWRECARGADRRRMLPSAGQPGKACASIASAARRY
jgi:hypothetical protein